MKQQQPHYRSASATGSSSLSRWLRLFAGFSAEPSLRTIRDFYAMFVPYRGLLLVSEALASVVSQHLKKQCQKRMVINAFHLIHGGFPESNALWHCSSPVINKIIITTFDCQAAVRVEGISARANPCCGATTAQVFVIQH